MMLKPNINQLIKQSINNALIFLAKEQRVDGSFLSYSSTDKDMARIDTQKVSVYGLATILYSLSVLPTTNYPKIANIKDQLANCLLNQKSAHWTWNYWLRNSNQNKINPFPDDLDDTFCSLAALWKYNKNLITGQSLAVIVKVLTALETQEGGPYSTWVTTPSPNNHHWQDVDLVVNSNIAYFLSLLKTNSPRITQFTDTAILNQAYFSKYYPSKTIIFYFMTRWYQGQYQKNIVKALINLLSSINSDQSQSLFTALICNSLIRLNQFPSYQPLIEQKINLILASQHQDGSWQAQAICLDPSVKGKRHFAGSKTISTAIIIETLALYLTANQPTTSLAQHSDNQLSKRIIWQINHKIDQLPPNLKPNLQIQLNHILEHYQQHHIMLSHYYFAKSYLKTQEIDFNLIITLGVANIWGWLAYTLFDKFIDQQTTQLITLPLIPFALRELHILYAQQFNYSPEFLVKFQQLLDTQDTANIWELTAARALSKNHILTLPIKLPSYSPITLIAEKSIGATLSSLAIIYYHQQPNYYQHVQFWLEFMYRQLTIRQLNDDLHDWEDDLKKGKLTPIVTMMIKNLIKQQSNLINNHQLKLNQSNWPILRQFFWQQVLPKSIKLIQHQITLAQMSLKTETGLRSKQFFNHLLDNESNTTLETLHQQKLTTEFIKHY